MILSEEIGTRLYSIKSSSDAMYIQLFHAHAYHEGSMYVLGLGIAKATTIKKRKPRANAVSRMAWWILACRILSSTSFPNDSRASLSVIISTCPAAKIRLVYLHCSKHNFTYLPRHLRWQIVTSRSSFLAFDERLINATRTIAWGKCCAFRKYRDRYDTGTR